MHSSMRRLATTAAAVTTAVVITAAPSLAAPTPGVGQLFGGGAGSASYDKSVSVGGAGVSVRLDVPDPDSYAGFEIKHAPAALPQQAPSFALLETGTHSGGSPRLVIESAGGCVATEYALTASATTWTTASQWDLMGSCGSVGRAPGWVLAAFPCRSWFPCRSRDSSPSSARVS